ncbi:MAG TPA: tetratricopeptide repeat protein, partial [Thermoguttaceae bacterium]
MKFLLFNNYGSLVIAVTIFCIGMFAQSIVADEDTQTWEQLTASAVVAMKDGNNAQAQRLCNQAMKLLGEGTPGDTRLTKTYMLMGEIHRRGNGLEPAEQSYKKAIALCEKAVGPNHPDMAIPLDALANFYYFTQIRYDLVAPLYERILNIVANDPNRDDREVARRSRN